MNERGSWAELGQAGGAPANHTGQMRTDQGDTWILAIRKTLSIFYKHL